MGQSKVVRCQELEPEVDFYGWCLQDADLSQVPVPYPGDRAMETFVSARPGRVDITSAGHTHTAVLRAEVWDGKPPAEASQTWEVSGDADLRCRTGSLQVWGVSCGPIAQEVQLGAPDGAWNVRVYCAGRREVVRAIEDEGIAEGVERYLVQFWPRHE